AVQRKSGRGGRRSSGAGRERRPDTALEDADFDFRWGVDANEFHISFVREIRMVADLRPQNLPRFAVDLERVVISDDHKMGIAGRNFGPFNYGSIGEPDRSRNDCRNPHAGGDVDAEAAVAADAVYVAHTQAGVGRDFNRIARLRGERFGHPRGDAARAVTTDLSSGTVGIVEMDAACAGPCPAEEFDSVGTDAGAAGAKTAGEIGAIGQARGVVRYDQEIVAAGMGFGEGNQASSAVQDWRYARFRP